MVAAADSDPASGLAGGSANAGAAKSIGVATARPNSGRAGRRERLDMTVLSGARFRLIVTWIVAARAAEASDQGERLRRR